MAPGFLFLGSLFYLTAVVVVVYSVAQEPFAPVRHLVRQAMRRAAKLLGVLAALMVVVFFLSRV
ncbi:MAG: hypothetical protein D6691_00730 [Candidatus Hydrogenedentota bacterium]|jgi:hypothetical protein|uniref:Uncharacterized protein n=1 Tax=Sumerlaea chitinivorans TaxID=2250252 RepID=A0A2Z4Y6J4_SUMC1|nr:hypothetical protein BRCON_1681 [Candidatus Sumerlaea chitinivorans]MCX7962884.1 hypothetical protein [Candidatus Sumerlaea chitinivorans]RMH30819.1 MAG: hypothetical protein D6691_00730 [Candidatus Hydrogenedentota bacterium]GIX45786.1 MAG: hypothetical protein KatS3mg130_2194 [Candidatus Sumerlaea sp.]